MNERLDKQLHDAHGAFNQDHQRLRAEMLDKLPGQRLVKPGRPRAIVLRLIGERKMKSVLPRLAAVAALIVIVGVAATVLFQNATTTAYAIEQTLEANKTVRSIHIVLYPPTRKGSIDEAWAEFDQSGELLHLRMDFKDTADGPKVVVWENGKATVWMSAKKVLLTVSERSMLSKLRDQMAVFDPRLALEKIRQEEAEGTVTVETHQPEDTSEPITLIATSSPEPTRREVCLIDPRTKLMIQRDLYTLREDEYVLVVGQKYLDYNQPIPPEVFNIHVPDDAMRIDQTTQRVGLAKGDLSDEEISVDLVRQFFEALIAEDCAKAGRLFSGIPADRMKQMLGTHRFLRIISIGKPVPHPIPGVGGYRVACKVEVESNGEKVTRSFPGVCVRAVYNQPDRWEIHGGI